MTVSADAQVLAKTLKLVEYLAEVTDAAERDPVRDILSENRDAPEKMLWLAELPPGVRITPTAADGVLLRLRPPRQLPVPRPPDELRPWLDPDVDLDDPLHEPRLLAHPGGAEPPETVRQVFASWSVDWRDWQVDRGRQRDVLQLYSDLEYAAKVMEQQDDEFEFVLGIGLVSWRTPSDEIVRRHLVTEAVAPRIDRATAEITVVAGAGHRRVEDKEILGGEDVYQPERSRILRQRLIDADVPTLDRTLVELMRDWLMVGVSEACRFDDDRPSTADVSATVALSPSPCLLLRPRVRVLLAEAYRRIAAELRSENADIPVALAQLVVDTEPQQRDEWLRRQGAASGDLLGADPLFPLPTNAEQERVIDLLRSETCVVVQGPPGTGKTHTIANLVSALLARGQRVLVTSQKDQALRVLRDKIPPDLRRLCVLLAGGSKDTSRELAQGLDALSEAQASTATAVLPARIAHLEAQRAGLRSRAAELNDRVRQLRDEENVEHPSVAPCDNDGYSGTLGRIVRHVKKGAPLHSWIPPVPPEQPDRPPLGLDDLVSLLRLLRSAPPGHATRGVQYIPTLKELPSANGLAELVSAERQAGRAVSSDDRARAARLAVLDDADLAVLQDLAQQVEESLRRLDVDGPRDYEWSRRALDDGLAGRNGGLWAHLAAVCDEPQRLQERLQAQGVDFVVEVPSIDEIGVGRAKGLLTSGRRLLAHLDQGGRIRRWWPDAAQKQATDLLETVRVDGRRPEECPQLGAALDRLEADIAATLLIDKWADADIPVSGRNLTQKLSDLADKSRTLRDVETVVSLRDRVAELCRAAGSAPDLSTIGLLRTTLAGVDGARRLQNSRRLRDEVDRLAATVRTVAQVANACPELAALAAAVDARDADAYRLGLVAVEAARAEKDDQSRLAALLRTLRTVHPQLADLLVSSAQNAQWDSRIRNLPAAWAWSKAEQFVSRQRNVDEERGLVAEFDQIDEEVRRTTEQLAATRALWECVSHMTDAHARALRSYREHMGHIGAGAGRRTADFRRAARGAMDKAKGAVPAWVVPLPNLLDNIAAERDAFDVVIVDEASQVGLENLFLLWMAPRVIVVGDEKQCTPGISRLGRLDDLFTSLGEHLGDIDEEIRNHLTSKSNLYGLLSARSGRNAVVRLREHFRCMSEIINWSSGQFYGEAGLPGLVALRERRATDLEPLRVELVRGAYTDGRNQTKRNPVEAKAVVARLVECLEDPLYRDKTFGVVSLQGEGQRKLLELEIAEATTPEQRERHKVRVGTPPNFQGDERDVVFLSMVVAEPPRLQRAQAAAQMYNVAASRAKDQMWLFCSVRLVDLKPEDLRASLLGYMQNPPSVFGPSPALDEVSETQRCQPFDSLFEQRVFRDIRGRGYHVVPQYRVGTRSLDMVVVGPGGRVGVECDGHYWHSGLEREVSDARRDRDLRRINWEVVRVRESEYEFDPQRALRPLWKLLSVRGIEPRDPDLPVGDLAGKWTPIELPQSSTADQQEDVA